MNRRLALGLLAATSLAACSFDLSLPEAPQRGGVLGKVDTAGHVPLKGNQVVLVAEDGTRTTQDTNEQGEFTFGDLTPGLFYLECKIPGFAPFVRPNIKVLAGQQYDLGTLAPLWLQNTPNAALVTGKVTIEGGAGSTQGAQVEFVLQGVNQTVALAAVTATGQFVERVPPGTYTLRASHPLFVTKVLADVVLGDGEQKDLSSQPLVLALNPAVITGRLKKEVDGKPAVDAAGALVTFEGSGATTTTDATGAFSLGGLPAGQSTVRFTLAGFHDAAASHAVTLTPGMSTAMGDFTLQLDRGDLVGEVRTADGQPVQDATVSVPGTSYAAQVVPDPNQASKGTFQLKGLPVGSYAVRATKTRYLPAVSASVMVTASASTALSAPLTLALQQGDFEIDDGDVSNAPGYARTTAVTLKFNFSGAATYRASEDPTFTGVAFSPYTGSSQPFTLSGAQGTHVVYAQFEDAQNNRSPSFSSAVVLDSLAPSTPAIAINGGLGFTRQANPLALTLTATEAPGPSVDTVSGLGFVTLGEAVQTDGGIVGSTVPYLRDLPFVPSDLNDGTKTVFAQFVDNAGNRSAVVSASVVVDSAPPTGTTLSIARGPHATVDHYTDSALVQLTLGASAEPAGGQVLVRLANSTSALSSATYALVQKDVAWFVDPTTQGQKTVYAEFRDSAGNSATVVSDVITYDTLAPNPVTLATAGGFAITSDAGVALTLSAVDVNGLSPTQGLTLAEDPSFQNGTLGPAAMPGSGAITFTLPPGDGPRRIFARFRDVAGNDAITSVAVTLDTQAPTGTVDLTGSLADGTPSTTRTATASVSAAVSANGATGYLLGDDSLASCPSAAAAYTALPANTSALPAALDGTPGSRQVKLCLRDAAGNVGGPFTDSLFLDATPPTGCTVAVTGTQADGVTAAPAGLTARSQVSARVQGCSADVTEYFLVNGTASCSASVVATWVPYSAPSATQAFLLSGGDGPNQVSGCYRDASRNVGTLAAASITLDATPPAALGVALNDGARYLGIAQLDGGQPAVKVVGTAVGATQWAVSEGTPGTFVAFPGSPSTTYVTLGGSGVRTVYARFRDDLGNLSGVVSATIEVDTSPPSVAAPVAFRIGSSDGGAFISNPAVTLLTTPPADAVQAQLVEHAPSSPCVATDFDAGVPTAVASSYLFQLSPGDADKRVCIRWLDVAGNPSAPLFDTKTLDTTAPPQPIMISVDRVFNPGLTGEDAGSWVSIANIVDPRHSDWQVLGGQAGGWTSAPVAAPSPSTPGCAAGLCVRALLNTSTIETGAPNVIRVREVDYAGNASDPASVMLTTDVVPPRPVSLSSFWVDNRNGQGVVHWQRFNDAGSPDVVAHAVYYGAAPGQPGDAGNTLPTGYAGSSAAEGVSPILVGNVDQASLSTLANGSLAYVTVRPIDRAGNVGGPPTGVAEVVLQPNEVSPTHLMTLPLMADAGASGGIYANSVEVVGSMAYVFGGTTGGQSIVSTYDLGTVVGALQGGQVGVSTPPTPYAPVKVTDGQSFAGRAGAMTVDGPYLFTASGNHFRVWSIMAPTSPTPVVDVDLSLVVSGPLDLNTLEVRGDNAFVGGYRTPATTQILFNINLADLWDGDQSTTVTTADVSAAIGTGDNIVPQAMLWSRDRLFFGNAVNYVGLWDLTNALDGSTLTAMGIGNRIANSLGLRFNKWRGLAGGNIAIVSEPSALRLLDISTAWSSTSPYFNELSRVPLVAAGQYQVAGDQFFVGEDNYSGLQTASLYDFNQPRGSGAVRPAVGTTAGPSGLGLYGNFVVQATDSSGPGNSLRLYEVAAPRALHSTLSLGYPSGRSAVLPGFVVSSSGLVVDMMNTGLRRSSPTVGDGCVSDGVVIDDTLVSSRWNGSNGELRITRLDNFTGRAAVPGTIAANSVTYTSSPVERISGLSVYGNYLVAVTARPTGTTPPTALFVEVFDAGALRSRATGAARTLSSADRIASYQFDTSNITHTVFNMRLRMNGPYAVVTTKNVGAVTAPTAYLLDLSPMLDDSTLTAMGANNVLGRVGAQTGAPFGLSSTDGVLKGNRLYLAANTNNVPGMYIYDASDAFDGNAGTVLNGDDLLSVVPQAGANSLDLVGPYAVVTGATAAATVSAYDMSQTPPRLLTEVAYTGQTNAGSCYTDLGTWTTIIGSRVYVGSYERFDAYELE